MSRESHHDTLLKVQRTLTAWVDAVAQPAEETRLFQQACDLIVGAGVSRMAWFGYASDSARRIGDPVAVSGDDDGFLDELKLAISRDGFEDPACICIRTGDVCWIQDLAAQPALGPVQSAALRRGYTSVLSVPTMTNEKPCGALSLYFGEHERYGPEIADLLRARLAHAMAAFARSAQRDTGLSTPIDSPLQPNGVWHALNVTAAKEAEDKLRQSESELRQVLDFAPQHVYVLGPEPNSMQLYVNRAALDYLGLTLEEWQGCDRRKLFHPDDWERARSETQGKISAGIPHEAEARLLGKDGKYRRFLLQWNPIRDERGRLTRWYVAGTDLDDRKMAEQRLRNENASLREEIDRSSMFEEIVGTSAALQKVLSRISKVSPTDSGVLITGETGSGKELVARAIHRRSRRSSQGFVTVNCAAIPSDLIASELFGHEKGAFTGATRLRLGRFELAAGGTIFLDEIGELPAETQIALLRVLQEQEFQRIGGTATIRSDARVIAATNRDLEAAISAGTFRSDLFYRLNVFPIEMPALRERREDIPLLVKYFLDRYARKARKRFRTVDRRSLELLQAYAWPGNIRELQNVIERSVIVSECETFSVDESWLSSKGRLHESKIKTELSGKPGAGEKEMIEAALRQCGGRVSGPSGAAARLGIPGSTLESKIRSLRVDKNRFKT